MLRRGTFARWGLALSMFAAQACAPGGYEPDEADEGDEAEDQLGAGLSWGASFQADGSLRVRVRSSRATRVEVLLFPKSFGADAALQQVLTREGSSDAWSATIPASSLTAAGLGGDLLFYGYRVWGPNWTYTASWRPGSQDGFNADVDANGNRMNPNKLLADPYALELSHDPINPSNTDGTVFASGPQHRTVDDARVAPKSVVFPQVAPPSSSEKPTRSLKDETIYEVHVRGFTMNDSSVPAELRGTYAGAAMKAKYLKSIGVTAIEFLPIHETQNEQNDLAMGTDGDNYWGYMTLGYFAPERRYAADKTPGGPTRELRAMIQAFHAEGIKVYVDVVYNHTAEGGNWDGTGDTTSLYSLRGLDNAAYYELANDARFFYDNTGIGANLNVVSKASRDLVIDSLRYYKDTLGFDGFRFDLASVLGNGCDRGCYRFDKMDPNNILNRAVRELPARPDSGGEGVDLIAEPWAIGDGSYQVGGFPWGWAEWNGSFRDVIRSDQNQLGVTDITPGELATRVAGSNDLYQDDGRKPFHSINFLTAHDGFTLRDLYAYNGKNNGQAWPYGPSDGGEDDNRSWDQGGNAAAQRQAARTGFALLMLSAGTPMITGGDEMYRTQHGNNNAYNLDATGNWLDWSDRDRNASFAAFTSRMMRFRAAHPALRRASFFTGSDKNANGVKDITWLADDGSEAQGWYMTAKDRHFLGYRVDASEAGEGATSILVLYNGWSGTVTARLPGNVGGKRWYRVADTASWMEGQGNAKEPGGEEWMNGTTYDVAGRSLVLMIER